MNAWSQALSLALLAALTAAQAADVPVQRQGVASCAQSFCHGSARPLAVTAVLQNEYVSWSSFDPHSRALSALRGEPARRIARRLGMPNAYEAKVCRDCHTDNVPETQRGPKFQLSDGVGCEACHGAAQGWIAEHSQAPSVSHAQNLQRGLVALEQPAVRARVCSGCHVGDRDRLATHAMMAAGHPRLAFELDTFSEIWRTSGGREHYRRDADYTQRIGGASSSRMWLAGLLESARLRLELIESRARGTGLMPEFAVYNCYSCHRSMRAQQWARSDEGSLAPGALRFDSGAFLMLTAVLQGLKSPLAAELRRAVLRWQGAAADADALAAAQRNLRRLLGQAASSFGAAQGPVAARAMLDALVASAQHGDYPDYNAAEQAAMGMVVLLAEQGADRQSRPDVDALFKALQDDSRYDARRFARLAAVLPGVKR